MRNVNRAAVQRLKTQLRQESMRLIIVGHGDCTERELYLALICAMELEGRTKEELEYFSQHCHFPGRPPREFHSAWKTEARQDQTVQRRGLRIIEDILPGIDPATLNKSLLTVKKFRGKGADELDFIAVHRRDPESFAELASFAASRQLYRPQNCPYCKRR